jgi:hypothetical protein
MQFELRAFLRETLLDNVGHKPDREIRYAAQKWLDKGDLEERDVAEIQTAIDEKNAVSNAEITERGAEYGY